MREQEDSFCCGWRRRGGGGGGEQQGCRRCGAQVDCSSKASRVAGEWRAAETQGIGPNDHADVRWMAHIECDCYPNSGHSPCSAVYMFYILLVK